MTQRRRLALLAISLAMVGESAGAQQPAPLLLPPPSSELPLSLAPPGGQGASDLESLLPPLVEESPPDNHEAGLMESCLAPSPEWYEPAYWFGLDPWDAGVELGINGSEGNNNVFSMRTGAHLKRESKRWKFDSSLNYNKNHTNGVETQNNGKLDSRLDRNIAESAWTLFVLENLIYDEFQSYDIQLSLNAGVGYHLVKTTETDLTSRVGAGATREIGGVDNDWAPQALFGLDFTHALSTMQRLTAKVDYFPEWADFRNYRVVSDAGWEVDLDQPRNLSLKLSLIDRYDSTPDGAEPNNVDYAVLLIWKL